MKEIMKEIEKILKYLTPNEWYHIEFSTNGKYIDELIITKNKNQK